MMQGTWQNIPYFEKKSKFMLREKMVNTTYSVAKASNCGQKSVIETNHEDLVRISVFFFFGGIVKVALLDMRTVWASLFVFRSS